ncbi:hypothetical protein A3E39_01060 [Candidatus Uhrbacteria bacterium RIFCSPHIGHO2_12_FULL_60_25]|uniref:DUF378 domain-containing protein n=1 Tax=Candidatus Uhrbacteria bacterium RIFCSPHIGHO2_12_FULL_60_25 TaxID=1802399 RepID=A0A1F7UKK6_9BACT|nr:MAG: hypothetical protein A3D73_02425 [Candidatus Uhrbacteria bacterium RIFCSPHIGHO2_02_FULL_60_44]OGL78812.1 MAG: hypothetical protein A3E39_01060 [Candidatus Uhrbacteria bacterium RIFCSPHIGHO2_12_FULL_60_25]
MGKMCGVHKIAWILVLIGGINWGLVGGFQFNLVEAILGQWPVIVRVVYVLVGLSALAMLGAEKCCMGKDMMKK